VHIRPRFQPWAPPAGNRPRSQNQPPNGRERRPSPQWNTTRTNAKERAGSPSPGGRRRARCEDRIRGAKDAGLRNLPLKGYAQNQLWCEIIALACRLLAWMQMLALTGKARRWEPKRLRLRLFAVAGRLASSGRRMRLRLAGRWPWAGQITAAAARLQAIPSG
jgi:DDE family transposase